MRDRSFFTDCNGKPLYTRDWRPDEPRMALLLVHGLGEHCGRYDALASRLTERGVWVRGYDQRGHGQTEGPRGRLDDADDLPQDCARMLDLLREESGLEPLLLGHSMGGLVAASSVVRALARPRALVLSSPALAAPLNWLQQRLIDVLPFVLPNLAVGNGLDAGKISHAQATVDAYRADPLVHDRITPRLARLIRDRGEEARRLAGKLDVPTLMLVAGDDRLVDPAGSRAFAAAAPAGIVQFEFVEGGWHELFNEIPSYREPVLHTLERWLDAIGGVPVRTH
jgi:alpha-beta hydrolase superfamily lysophospholipase